MQGKREKPFSVLCRGFFHFCSVQRNHHCCSVQRVLQEVSEKRSRGAEGFSVWKNAAGAEGFSVSENVAETRTICKSESV